MNARSVTISLFCETLKELMEDSGFSNNEQFAHALGMDRNAIDRWFSGKYSPSIESVRKIADFFNCSADYLFGLSDKMEYTLSRGSSTFCERYEKLVKQNDITHYRVAKECNIKLPTVTKWRKLNQIPNIETMVRLTEVLNCTLDYIIGRSDK